MDRKLLEDVLVRLQAHTSLLKTQLTELEDLSRQVREHLAVGAAQRSPVAATGKTPSELQGRDHTNRNLRDARLSGLDLREHTFLLCRLNNACLSQANLSGVQLTGANLTGADLTGASLRNANCQNAVFSGASLRGASLRGADVSGANFLHADLEGADLSNIQASEQTRWPSPRPEQLDFSR